ncbi:MAG TPA: M1 family metallopeptidase [Saprospiraceae bacterium]|nr:M1 family metallopeptidase [Saprospiraceae bacterium]
MRHSLIITILFVLIHFYAGAQRPFQQRVDVSIQCQLDDEAHHLHGQINMEYFNNSPDTLSFIYMHLWPNAYKDRNTAFTQQKLRMKNTDFYFAKEEERGMLDSLDFSINGSRIDWALDEEFIDIAKIKLSQPLLPGQSCTISTPFLLDIPVSYSRLGRVGTSYQLTQWFPKPAVYDQDGWHPMPYLDIGEFYSEFGDYEVEITLPENYVVAATGTLQEESEYEFLNRRMQETLDTLATNPKSSNHPFPKSADKMKTISYKAENVHDFAWFADKRFYVIRDTVTIQDGDRDTWVFFTNQEIELWKDAINYVNRSVEFYSEKVGTYPYPQATAVQSALSAGAGMEYPMITVIGLMGDAAALDNVITHEVGHNWFYGILAFNERDHVWMDEGINSYYDHRYMDEYYPGKPLMALPPILKGHSPLSTTDYALLYKMRDRADQAPTTHSNKFNSEINYFIGGYEKPAQAFKYLQNYLGTERFDRIMQDFYEEWKFHHPQPEDFRNYFEQKAGEDLSWFFDGLIGSNKHIDYKIADYDEKSGEAKIRNKGEIPAPIPLGFEKEEEKKMQWLDGFDKKKVVQLEKEIDQITLDPLLWTLDVRRSNNYWDTKKFLPGTEPLKVQLLSRLANPEENQLFVLPTGGWNYYDKIMLGLGVHNIGMIQRPFEFALLPMYGMGSNDVIGVGTVRYHHNWHSTTIQGLDLGLNFRRFNYADPPILDDDHLAYNRWNPFVKFNFIPKAGTPRQSWVKFEAIHLQREEVALGQDLNNPGTVSVDNTIYRAKYKWSDNHAIQPKNLWMELEYQDFENRNFSSNEYLKLSAKTTRKYQYKKNKFFRASLFASYFIVNDARESGIVNNPIQFNGANIALNQHALSDYAFDDVFFARTERSDLLARAVSTTRGPEFKLPINQWPNSNDNLGLSNDFAASLHLRSDLPFKLPALLPLEIYFDLGYFRAAPDSDLDEVFWSGGFMLNYADGAFQVFFPVAHSKDVRNALDEMGGNYLRSVTFAFNLSGSDPLDLRKSLL